MEAACCVIHDPLTGRPLTELRLLSAGTAIVNEARRLSRDESADGNAAFYEFLRVSVMISQIILEEKTYLIISTHGTALHFGASPNY
jgi:hypothetical protein